MSNLFLIWKILVELIKKKSLTLSDKRFDLKFVDFLNIIGEVETIAIEKRVLNVYI